MDEEIVVLCVVFEEELWCGGVDEDSLLGLRIIGVAGAREGWDDEEVVVFVEYVM